MENDLLEENNYICQAYNQVNAVHTTILIQVKSKFNGILQEFVTLKVLLVSVVPV